jgi:hypothetical protein
MKTPTSSSWKRGFLVLFATASFFLLCLINLDYYQNCSASDCAVVHSSLGFFYKLDFAALIPVVNRLPIPLMLRLLVPSLFLFSLMLFSFFMLMLYHNGLAFALMDTVELAFLVTILFEVGLYFLNPLWWQVHFSNLSTFPFSVVTNEDVAAIAGAALLITFGGRIVFWMSAAKKS